MSIRPTAQFKIGTLARGAARNSGPEPYRPTLAGVPVVVNVHTSMIDEIDHAPVGNRLISRLRTELRRLSGPSRQTYSVTACGRSLLLDGHAS